MNYLTCSDMLIYLCKYKIFITCNNNFIIIMKYLYIKERKWQNQEFSVRSFIKRTLFLKQWEVFETNGINT